MSDYLIPFNQQTGRHLDYVDSFVSKVEWRKNLPFEAKMKIVKSKRGRSAAHFLVTDLNTNMEYTMFLKDFIDCIQKANIIDGIIRHGAWIFAKRGQNYGVKIFVGDTNCDNCARSKRTRR